MKNLLKISLILFCTVLFASCGQKNQIEENSESAAIDSAAAMGAAEGSQYETPADSAAIQEVDSIVKAN